MKITEDHFNQLKVSIDPNNTEDRRQRYRDKDFRNSASVKDLDKRYRWDLLYLSVSAHIINEIYLYANDDHIDTALRRIVKPL